MKRLFILSIVTTLSLLLGASAVFACDGDKNNTTAATEIDATATAQLVTLRVEAATCGSCVIPIRQELTTLTGVIKVEGSEADYKDILVTVDGKITHEALIAAVKKAGYDAVVKAPAATKKNS